MGSEVNDTENVFEKLGSKTANAYPTSASTVRVDLHLVLHKSFFFLSMGARTIFSRCGQIRGSGDTCLPAGSRGVAPVGVWGQSPQKPRNNCENNA